MAKKKTNAKTEALIKAAQELKFALTASPDAVPDGWFTYQEFAEANQLKLDTARRMLNLGAAVGRLEKAKFRALDIDGRIYYQSRYRLK